MNKEKIKRLLKKDINNLTLNEMYTILVWFAGITFFIILGFLIASIITREIDSIVKLLVPFGVLLSAGLASISVMKSIDNTNKIEREKEEKRNNLTLKRFEYYLNHIDFNVIGFKKTFEIYELFIKEEQELNLEHIELVNRKTNDILNSIRDDKEIIEMIDNKLIIDIVMNTELLIDILKKIITYKIIGEGLDKLKKNFFTQIEMHELLFSDITKKYNLEKINFKKSSN